MTLNRSLLLRATGVFVACAFALTTARADSLTLGFTPISVPGAIGTLAGGINDSGAIAGTYFDENGNQHGFVDNGGTFTTLDVPGGFQTEGISLNNNGQVVGLYETDDQGDNGGFIYNAGSFTTFTPPTQCGCFTPYGINNAGQIAGDTYIGTSDNFQPLADGEDMYGVNDSGTYVGLIGDTNAETIDANGNHTQYAPYAGASYIGFEAINDNGLIAGYSDQNLFLFNPQTQNYTFLNTPNGDPDVDIFGLNDSNQLVMVDYDNDTSYLASPVPEPAPWLLLATGLLGLGLVLRRRLEAPSPSL